MTDAAHFTGRFLLALPGIGDPRFEHAVIAISKHDSEGAMGIGVGHVINGLTVGDIFSQLDIAHDAAFDQPVHFGGPVDTQRGFVIHSQDWGGQDSIDVAGRWSVSSSLDILRAIAEGRGPTRWLIALGYAGWDEGQLDGEMVHHAWHVTQGSDALLFDTPPFDRWAEAFAGEGIDARLLAGVGGRA